jgi:hypothetical protein
MEGQHLFFLFPSTWFKIKGCFGILYRFFTDFLTSSLYILSFQFLLDIFLFCINFN